MNNPPLMFPRIIEKLRSLPPTQVAVGILLLSLGLVLMHGKLSLQNDDFQIYFMLCGGGTEPAPFSLYTNVCLGYVVSFLSAHLPGWNWYLSFLFALGVLSCIALNIAVCKRVCGSGDAVRMAAVALLLYVDYEFLANMQYTHVAVAAACSAIIFLTVLPENGSRSFWWGAGLAAVLIIGAYSLRASSLLPAAFVLVGLLAAQFKELSQRNRWKPLGIAMAIPMALCCLAFAINKAAYAQNQEWNDAQQFLQARVQILDSKDNSGIDKTPSLQAAGIRPEAFLRFKQFIYEPEMDNLPAVLKAKDIHKQGRKGVCGLAPAADMGLLQFELSNIKPKSTLLRFITPYVPIAVALFVLIAFPERKRITAACIILGSVACYLVVLALMDRMVGRVLNPVLYTAGLYVLSTPFVKKPHAGLIRSAGVVAVSCLACAFCLRHYRPFEAEPQEALEYCQSKPDTQFYTCCMQGCGLYPTGFGGYTFNYLKNTNVIPIADGWIFYTPAYKAMLKARRIDNPYLAMLSPNVELITFTRNSPDGMLRAIADEILRHTNTRVSFELVNEVPDFAFWRIVPRSMDEALAY